VEVDVVADVPFFQERHDVVFPDAGKPCVGADARVHQARRTDGGVTIGDAVVERVQQVGTIGR